MKTAKSSITLLSRVREVALLQADILILFGQCGEMIAELETFTEDDLRMIVTSLEGIMTNTEDSFSLLEDAFLGLFDDHVSDIEKLELLTTVGDNLATNRNALLELQRYVRFMENNRQFTGTRATDLLFNPIDHE